MEKRHLFERENQQRALREFDGLAKIKQLVDWEVFRPRLEQVFGSGGKRRWRGRPPWDAVVMFRALLLGAMHGLSDHQLQFMLLDRTFQGVCRTEEHRPSAGPKDVVEVSRSVVEKRLHG